MVAYPRCSSLYKGNLGLIISVSRFLLLQLCSAFFLELGIAGLISTNREKCKNDEPWKTVLSAAHATSVSITQSKAVALLVALRPPCKEGRSRAITVNGHVVFSKD